MKIKFLLYVFIFHFGIFTIHSQSNMVDANLMKPTVTLVFNKSEHILDNDIHASIQEDKSHVKLNNFFVECDDIKCLKVKQIDGLIINQFKDMDFISSTIYDNLTYRQKQILSNLSNGLYSEIKEEMWFKNKINSLYIVILYLNKMYDINNERGTILNTAINTVQGGGYNQSKKVLTGFKGEYIASLYKIEISELDYINFLKNYQSKSLGFNPTIIKVASVKGTAQGYSIIGHQGQISEKLLKKRLINDAFSNSLAKFSSMNNTFTNKFALDGASSLYFKKEQYDKIGIQDLLDSYQYVQVDKKIIKKRTGSVRIESVNKDNGIVVVRKNELGKYSRGMLLEPRKELGISIAASKSLSSISAQDYNLNIRFNILKNFKILNKRHTSLNFKIGLTSLEDQTVYIYKGLPLPVEYNKSKMLYYSAGITEMINLNQLLNLDYGVFINSRNLTLTKEKELKDLFSETLPNGYGSSLDLNLYMGLPITIHRIYSIIPYGEFRVYNIKNKNGIAEFSEIKKTELTPKFTNKLLLGLKLSINI